MIENYHFFHRNIQTWLSNSKYQRIYHNLCQAVPGLIMLAVKNMGLPSCLIFLSFQPQDAILH